MKFVTTLLMLALFAATLYAQNDTKTIRSLKLKLKETQLILNQADAQFNKADASFKEAQTLFERGLYNKTELSKAEEDLSNALLKREQASINLEKTRLAFLNSALHISLDKASIYRGDDGARHALLVLRNDSDTRSMVFDAGSTYSDVDKQALLTIDNLTVRILKDNSLIGRPFEIKFGRIPAGQTRSADYVLQQETDKITVQMTYADTMVNMPVFLEKESKDDRIQVDATQFSQDGELGKQVAFKLDLERFADDDKKFALLPLNLPSLYTAAFRENGSDGKGGESNVSFIRFNKGQTIKTLLLTISMPREIPREQLNEKIVFYVVILDQFAQQRLSALQTKLQGRAVASALLDSAKLSYEMLELIPRGRAEMEITSSNLFRKVKLGEIIAMPITLNNIGTVKLDNIRMIPTLPMDWTCNVTPESDINIDVEQKTKIELEIIPAPDVVAGDYEIQLDARTQYEGRDIEAARKTLRITVEGKSNIWLAVILLLLLLGLIGGVAVFTIKLSRK